jgi:hypothetical protein
MDLVGLGCAQVRAASCMPSCAGLAQTGLKSNLQAQR